MDDPTSRHPRSLRVPRRPEAVAVARAAVDRLAEEMGFGDIDRASINLAVAEACNNAVLHGTRDPVTVRCQRRGDAIEIEIASMGAPFQPSVPASMPAATSESGRGRALMEGMMDTVEYIDESCGTRVRLRKRLPEPGGD